MRALSSFVTKSMHRPQQTSQVESDVSHGVIYSQSQIQAISEGRVMMVDPSEYLVIDVETNGLKVAEDDLLSISVFKPDDGKLFNRLLPLEKQDWLNSEAASIHGLTKKDLKDKKPLSQAELSALIEEFEMERRTVLSFGGRRFDERFLKQYMDDHGLVGLENVRFLDFKTMIHSSGNRFYPASKDNLCRAFGIEGVKDVHTSANDCILEWKLFERMGGQHLLVTGPNVFKLNPSYIMPASYIDAYTGLRAYAGIPKRYAIADKVYELELSDEDTLSLVKFPNNFTGNAIEHLITSMLKAERCNFRTELLANKMKLEYVGSFDGTAEPVYTEHRDDGSVALASSVYDNVISQLEKIGGYSELVSALSQAKVQGRISDAMKSHEGSFEQLLDIKYSKTHPELGEAAWKVYEQGKLTEAISFTNETIKPAIAPLVEFLSGILGDGVLSQELVVNADDNCLALCDLSSPTAAVEVKTGKQGLDLSKCANQLYYSSAGRDCYVVHIEWASIWRAINGEGENTKFVVEKVRFSEERPKRKRNLASKKARIRHAVTDWRLANPGADPIQCAYALWLDLGDVSNAWLKSDLSRMYKSVPNRGKKRETYEAIRQWRLENQSASRIDAASQLDISMGEIEKWWVLAGDSNDWSDGFNRAVLEVDDADIRDTIPDIADITNTYALWSLEKVDALRKEVYELCREVGISTSDNYWSLFSSSYELTLDDKKRLVSRLLDFRDHCQEELHSGVSALRIPLTKTRYKTRSYYMDFDSSRSRITVVMPKKGKGKGDAVVFVNDRKASTISPRSHRLYAKAAACANKEVVRAFIERSDEAPEGELVLAVCPNNSETIKESYWRLRYSDWY